MISVFDALNSVETAGQSLRSDEDRLGRMIETAGAEIARLRGEQAGLFRSLAEIRLDVLRQDRVRGVLDQAERRALAVIEEQEKALDVLTRRREALVAELYVARQQRSDLARRLSEAVDAVGVLEQATEKRMADDVAWQAQSARLAGAEARAEAAEDKAKTSEADRDEKSRPYLADRLFVYLWERGYGTSRYKAGSFSRFGDAFVARVVDYEPARRNYFALTEIPKRLREHADRLKAEVEEEHGKLIAIERAALEADGIEALEKAQAAAEQALEKAEQTIADLEQESARLEAERAALLGEDGKKGLAGALAELAASMQREDLRVLLRAALETPTPEDEAIVRRLQAIETDIAKQEQSADEARSAAIELARKRAEIERSRAEVRRYERQGGSFSNDKLIGDVLGGIIGGVLSSRELGDALRSGYRPGRSGGGRPSFPTQPNRGGFGGGFGGGSGGRRSGGSGGFRTGGGF